MNIERNNMFKKDFTYPLFSRVRKISDTTFSFVLKRSTFLFNKKFKPLWFEFNIKIGAITKVIQNSNSKS